MEAQLRTSFAALGSSPDVPQMFPFSASAGHILGGALVPTFVPPVVLVLAAFFPVSPAGGAEPPVSTGVASL